MNKTTALYAVGILTFFLTIFDGILGYTIPLDVISQGYSKTALGFIIGTSSIAGAAADILLSKFLTTSNFRRLFMAMYICCLLYALSLWKANTLTIYLLAMAFWGLYFDFKSFATFNFVGRFTPHRLHASSFGIIDVFKCLGYVIAPLIAGIIIVDKITDKPFIIAIIFLVFSLFSFFGLFFITKKTHEQVPLKKKNYSLLLELNTWRKIGKIIWPVLIFTVIISMHDSFFWTVGPLISEQLSSLSAYGGLFLTLYFLPTVMVGWFAGRITKHFGKKRTAFVSFALGSLFLTLIGFLGDTWLVLILIFISSSFSAIAWPASNAAYADYIEESPHLEQEIEGISDFAFNFAYTVGPIIAGLLADSYGNSMTLSLFGIAGVVVCIILLVVTPKKIHVPNRV